MAGARSVASAERRKPEVQRPHPKEGRGKKGLTCRPGVGACIALEAEGVEGALPELTELIGELQV